MTKSKLTRRALALRLFAVAALVNIFLLLCFWPSAPTTSVSTPKIEGIEIKVKGQLYTAFAEGKKVLLTRSAGSPVGTAQLLRLEEDGVVIALSEATYRQHHRSLINDEWALIPYIAGIEARPHRQGVSYEIAY